MDKSDSSANQMKTLLHELVSCLNIDSSVSIIDKDYSPSEQDTFAQNGNGDGDSLVCQLARQAEEASPGEFQSYLDSILSRMVKTSQWPLPTR